MATVSYTRMADMTESDMALSRPRYLADRGDP